jgi:hypothetical protein
MKAILLKRLTMEEYLNFGQKQPRMNKDNRPLFELEDMNSTIHYNYG